MTDPWENCMQTYKKWLFLCSFKCKCVDPVGNEARVIQIDILFYTNLDCIYPLPRMLALVTLNGIIVYSYT